MYSIAFLQPYGDGQFEGSVFGVKLCPRRVLPIHFFSQFYFLCRM